MLNALFAGLGMAAVSKLTAPKAPKAAALPAFDFDKETIAAMQARRESQDPQIRAILDQNYKTALTLSRGDIPDEVQRTIRSTMAENASTRGLSAAQFTRINAQALGATQMQMMAQGAQLTQTLETIRNNEWAVASDSALAKANRQYEAFALSEQQRMARYNQKSAEHSSLFSMLGTGVFAAVETSETNKQRDLDRKFYGDLYKQNSVGSKPYAGLDTSYTTASRSRLGPQMDYSALLAGRIGRK